MDQEPRYGLFDIQGISTLHRELRCEPEMRPWFLAYLITRLGFNPPVKLQALTLFTPCDDTFVVKYSPAASIGFFRYGARPSWLLWNNRSKADYTFGKWW